MPRTPFDKVIPEYRSAVPASQHWMNVCHPYFVPNQPGPRPACPPPPPGPPGRPPVTGHCGPLLDHAPLPCGAVTSRPSRPVVLPAPPQPMGKGNKEVVDELPNGDAIDFVKTRQVAAGVPNGMHRDGTSAAPPLLPPKPGHCTQEYHPCAPKQLKPLDPRDYDGNTQAPHPYIYWLAKKETNVEAGDNVDVTLSVDRTTGDKTYTVSSRIPEDEKKRIDQLERDVLAQLAEIRRIKGSMLTVDEDDTEEGNGIVFREGME